MHLTANATATQLRQLVPRLQGMATGVTSLQNVLRAVCKRFTQLQESVQREGQGLGELHRWSTSLGEQMQRQMQFLFQQYQHLGGQVQLTNQTFQDVQTFCQQGMAEIGQRHQSWRKDVTEECREICVQWQKGLEGRVHGAVPQQCEAWLRQMAAELRPENPTGPQAYLDLGERVAQLEREVDHNQKDLQAKWDHLKEVCRGELFASHHQMKQATAAVQQEKASNVEHFGCLDLAVHELHWGLAQPGNNRGD